MTKLHLLECRTDFYIFTGLFGLFGFHINRVGFYYYTTHVKDILTGNPKSTESFIGTFLVAFRVYSQLVRHFSIFLVVSVLMGVGGNRMTRCRSRFFFFALD